MEAGSPSTLEIGNRTKATTLREKSCKVSHLDLKIPLPLFMLDYGSKVYAALRLYTSRVPSQASV
jgi:hypothetical protein